MEVTAIPAINERDIGSAHRTRKDRITAIERYTGMLRESPEGERFKRGRLQLRIAEQELLLGTKKSRDASRRDAMAAFELLSTVSPLEDTGMGLREELGNLEQLANRLGCGRLAKKARDYVWTRWRTSF